MYAGAPDRVTRTRIVATLGPACWEPEQLVRLIDAGVDVFRINGSHSDHDTIRRLTARVRRAAGEADQPIAILLDLQGPKVRTGPADRPVDLAVDDVLTVVMDDALPASGHRIGTTYLQLVDDVAPGVEVLFADGALAGEVTEVRREAVPPEVDIRITVGGALGAHKGINLPGQPLSTPALTEKDRGDLEVGLDVGVDYVALSFVRSGDDVRELRALLAERGADMPIISKIEKPQALDALDDILDASDGVMVARGDLGVEVPLPEVPIHQKAIIEQAARRGRLVITATQMLDSMERNPRPTRAETTDVANAILDGTDAVMLSGETSVGSWPVETVRTMDAIARHTENSRFLRPTPMHRLPPLEGPAGATCRAACFMMGEQPRSLMVFTWSGATARFISRSRPPGRIFAFSPNQPVVDRLALAWGVQSFRMSEVRTIEAMIAEGERILLERGLVQNGEELVVLGGNGPIQGSTCFLKVHTVGED